MSKKDIKGRSWAGVVYPESMNLDWIEILEKTHLDVFISPLHDKDKNPDGSIKKEHWHVLIMWDNPTTWSNAKSLFDSIGGVMDPHKVESVSGYARYLLHLDNPEKFQYDRTELRTLGAADYNEIIQKTQVTKRTARELFAFVRRTRVKSFGQLIDYIYLYSLDDWLDIALNRNTRALMALISSNSWETENQGLIKDDYFVDEETGEIIKFSDIDFEG